MSTTPLAFDLDLLHRQFRHASLAPPTPPARIVSAGDTALTDGPRSDYTVFVVGIVTEPIESSGPTETQNSELWLRSFEYGQFAPRQLPSIIAKFYQRWTPERSIVEKINGSVFLQILCEQEFRKLEINPRISWLSASRQADAKRLRIEKLIRLHLADRLRLVTGPWIGDFLSQAEKYLGTRTNSCRRDDLLDAAAMLCRFVPA